ncbi:ABC transporter substrate-binding protein [Amycolatopsis vastitatis]|uniref:ABC transporter substrate-binding protein n=1 Tax=Amycolatopsis vastitatis TaxID=1905142 RepID=UPI00142DD620
MSRSNVEREAVLVPPDSPLRDVASLKGKTIGVAKGSSAYGQLLNTLHNNGLSTKDVKLSFLQPSEAYAAFTQHGLKLEVARRPSRRAATGRSCWTTRSWRPNSSSRTPSPTRRLCRARWTSPRTSTGGSPRTWIR